MKKIFFIPIILLGLFITNDSRAQNIPDGSTLSGSPSHVETPPTDFTSVTPGWPTTQLYNYTRVFTPTEPVLSIGSQTKMTINTTYTNGWGNAMLHANYAGPLTNTIYKPVDNRATRTKIDYLPYVVSILNPVLNGKFRKSTFTEQAAYYASEYPDEGETAYSTTVSSNEDGNPKVKMAAPGKEFTGENRGVATEMHVLGSGELHSDLNTVYILEYNELADQVCEIGTYGSGQLIVKWTKGEHNSELLEYTDKSGKLVCKRTPDGNSGYLSTYYVYNDLGKLTNIVPPAQSAIIASNTCISIGAGTDYISQAFTYNEYGQNVITRTPGKEGTERVVYDKYHRVFLAQTAQMEEDEIALFTLYDKQGRVVMTGVFEETHNMSQSYYDGIMNGTAALPAYLDGMSQPVDDEDKLEYWLLHDMPVNNYPVDGNGEPFLAACEIHMLNYYDRYDIAPANAVSFTTSYSNKYLTGNGIEIPAPYLLAHGKLVARKTRIIDNGYTNNWGSKKWITSVSFYDEDGNVIQTHTKNPWSDELEGEWDITTNQYNFNGQPVLSILDHPGTGNGNRPSGAIVQVKKTYDQFNGRLQTTEHRIGDVPATPWYNLNRYVYDELGKVAQKDLGFVERQEYKYNIRGELRSINDLYVHTLTPAAANKVTYASILGYDTDFDDKRYDGKLSGYQWRTAGSADPMAYGYTYDDAGRMTHAEYRYNNGSSWIKTARDYTTSNLAYDANGNMQSMTQKGESSFLNAVTTIDDLSYQYDASGTRLLNVEDNGNNSSVRINDFNDGLIGQTGNDYEYNKNGELITDQNRGITNITYNHSGQPLEITKGTDGSIKHIYTADGALLQKVVTDNTQNPATTTTYHYWGPFVYKNDDLEMVMHEEGRARYTNPGFAYDYFVKDHLGNVRNIVKGTMSYGSLEYVASFERISATIEEDVFDQIGNVRDLKPLGTPGDLESGILDGGLEDKRIGAAIMVHAMSGETFNLKGYGYYDNTNTAQYNTYPMPQYMLESLSDAMIAGAGTGIGENGLEHTVTISNLLSSTNYNVYETMKSAVTNNNYPRAYLNYLVFDENFDLQPAYSHVIQINGAPGAWHKMEIQGDQVMPINGYLLAYFSNESHMEVAVDNMHLINYESHLEEENHYYPHGVAIAEASQATVENQYLAQGNKLQTELGLNINHFNFRQYDAQIGRFMAVDPFASSSGQERLNPYQFCFNDPGNFTDPLGLFPGFLLKRGGMLFGGTLAEFVVTAKGPMTSDRGAEEEARGFDNAGMYFAMLAMQPAGSGSGSASGSGSGGAGGGNGSGSGSITLWNSKHGNGKTMTPAQIKTNEVMAKANARHKAIENKAITTIADALGKGTFIPGTAVGFVTETKAGKVLSMGGKHNYSTLSRMQQIGAVREMKIASTVADAGGKILGGAGVLLTIGDISMNGFNTSNSIDLAMGAAGFIPVYGWAISGGYFLVNEGLKIGTGMDLGQNIDELMK